MITSSAKKMIMLGNHTYPSSDSMPCCQIKCPCSKFEGGNDGVSCLCPSDVALRLLDNQKITCKLCIRKLKRDLVKARIRESDL